MARMTAESQVLVGTWGDGVFLLSGGTVRQEFGGVPVRGLARDCAGGLPQWLSGICDTQCMDSKDATVALIDRAGNLHLSGDSGCNWLPHVTGCSQPSGLVLV